MSDSHDDPYAVHSLVEPPGASPVAGDLARAAHVDPRAPHSP